jgi:predicted metal-dependent hydrolase
MEGEIIQIRGRNHRLEFIRGENDAEAAIWRLLKREAVDYLPARVRELSELHGYPVSGIKIRKMKSRWGSCTARKSINLNSWLVMLPEHLSDYVILHELVHTRIPDHSKRFWEELDRLTGGLSIQYRKELRSHQIMCFPNGKEDQ